MLRRADHQIQTLQTELANLKQTVEESNQQSAKEADTNQRQWNHQFQALIVKVEQLTAENESLRNERQQQQQQVACDVQERQPPPPPSSSDHALQLENTQLHTELHELQKETKILGEALLVTQQQIASLVERKTDVESKMQSFWYKSAQLEEHLQSQFQLQEDNLAVMKQEIVGNVQAEYERIMDTWDAQFEDLVQYVEDHKAQQEQRNTGMESTLNELESLVELQKGEMNEMEKRRQNLTTSIEELQQLQESVKEKVEKDMQASIKEMVTAANVKVDPLVKVIREEMEHLRNLKMGHRTNAQVLGKKNVLAHIEFEAVVDQARSTATKLQTVYEELREARTKFYESEQSRQQSLEAFGTSFHELSRRVANQSRTLKTNQRIVKEALFEKESAESELQVQRELYKESIEELTVVQEKLRTVQMQPLTKIQHIRTHVQDILSDKDVEEGCEVEVEARDEGTDVVYDS